VLTEQWFRGPRYEIHVMVAPRCRPVKLVDDLRRRAPNDYRQLVARFRRTVDYGPEKHDWFKVLEDADGLLQIRSDRYRCLLFPHPRKHRVLIVAHIYKKQGTGPDHHHVGNAQRLRREYLSTLESEEKG